MRHTAQMFVMLAAGLVGLMEGASAASAQDWRLAEAPVLTSHSQLTSNEMFVKAGEAYFSPDMDWIIFQAIPRPAAGTQPDEHYSMYAAELHLGERGAESTIGEPILLSEPGSANTCGWFNPKDPRSVIFGSTSVPPSKDNIPGYQRGTGTYSWAFPSEMEIVTTRIGSKLSPQPIFKQPGYTAEDSWSSDGRYILYANVDEQRSMKLGRADSDLWIYDSTTKERVPIVVAEGYDGGPFFGPQDEWICYRSDRKGNDLLQLFVAELDFDTDGTPLGIKREIALTDNKDVNWAPYWYPTRELLTYTSSVFGHFNYEVMAIEFDPEKPMDELATARITEAAGFDGLSVTSPDGKWMMWTSQRGDGASSQIWIARFNIMAVRGKLQPQGATPAFAPGVGPSTGPMDDGS